jgi:hypothetical protein
MTEQDAEMLRNLYAAVVMHALIGRGRLANGADETIVAAFDIANKMTKEATEQRPNCDGTNAE